ncbi:spike base protein, RCAP_Rcc01079 family [Erythrobacter sp. EC-HK427]|uniref:spike base protein, RCAP_Rcc01079 family n=1 Tax=Erythrobacter sp. EC-HK427 TaxID=2038396 RepID=UPI001250E071|nr:hypothetical protein [Erythrobacter sp. EC-HK427]VVT02336.1 conserved hypothetical protein [Erythrobacter sp. EC-HK427]
MPEDRYTAASDSVTAPARSCFAVQPDDTGTFPVAAKALYVGLGGDLVLRAQDDDADVTFRDVQPGSILPVRAVAVRATGTSAADIVALA